MIRSLKPQQRERPFSVFDTDVAARRRGPARRERGPGGADLRGHGRPPGARGAAAGRYRSPVRATQALPRSDRPCGPGLRGSGFAATMTLCAQSRRSSGTRSATPLGPRRRAAAPRRGTKSGTRPSWADDRIARAARLAAPRAPPPPAPAARRRCPAAPGPSGASSRGCAGCGPSARSGRRAGPPAPSPSSVRRTAAAVGDVVHHGHAEHQVEAAVGERELGAGALHRARPRVRARRITSSIPSDGSRPVIVVTRGRPAARPARPVPQPTSRAVVRADSARARSQRACAGSARPRARAATRRTRRAIVVEVGAGSRSLVRRLASRRSQRGHAGAAAPDGS